MYKDMCTLNIHHNFVFIIKNGNHPSIEIIKKHIAVTYSRISQLIFDRGSNTYNGLKIVYSISGVGKIGQICAEKCNWTNFLYHTHE